MLQTSIKQFTKTTTTKSFIRQFSKTSFTRNTINSQEQASTIQTQQPSIENQIQNQPQEFQQENLGTFKSFAEYRLKVSNQSPLAVRSKDFNANLRQAQHS
ncbi:hypothetical protein KGF54_005366 [Candida jiufengensis]|uniref:uncharacterized protein n=1 Tax=Candida jiufengensis TaxID=497108 RepID=UPI002224CF18|nr:uncharacterized protein KGF54_005366 [Candida jiufengensis]KAI5949889.1 hypothetical protein KGF54_005366 [Candida jiufengensis]